MRRKFADRKKEKSKPEKKETKQAVDTATRGTAEDRFTRARKSAKEDKSSKPSKASTKPFSPHKEPSKPTPSYTGVTPHAGMPLMASYPPNISTTGISDIQDLISVPKAGAVDPREAQIKANALAGILGLDASGTTTADTTTTTTADETEEDKKKKAEEEAKQKSKDKAKWLTDWWSENTKGQGYKERKNIFTGKMWGSQEAVSAKIADKINKGYYEIVWQKTNLGMTPMVVHKSTGTPVNPYTGNIVDTQTQGAQGGAYQNEMARITGIDPKNAGVFSMEYQTGNGLSVSEMKPEHALRFLMKKNKGAFEQFFLDSKKKGLNPFSVGTISSSMGAILNMITGSEALQVGNNLERAGWGKAIKNEDTGDYTVKLTEKGANNWAKTFEVPEWVSSEAVTKDRNKGWLSDILGTKKFPEAPINLDNLIGQGGYQTEGEDATGQTMGFAGSGLIPTTESSPGARGTLYPDFVPIAPQDKKGKPLYNWMPQTDLRQALDISGTPTYKDEQGITQVSQYPRFTPEGYNIGAYNPSRDYTGSTDQTQTRTGDGGGGGNGDDDDTTTPGPLTFDVYGRPIKKYDYTGGPEQLYLGGGWKRDGQYIGSPWGTHHFKSGGIANFKPYGY